MGPRKRHARQRAKTHATPVILVSVLGFMLLAGVAFGIGMLGNVSRWLSDLPDYTDANEYLVSEPTHILDANGTEIATFFVQNRESVTMDQVSPYVVKGTVDVEDERFYQHPGVDIIGIGRAVMAQLSGRSEGASTITQQLVRNTILSEEQFDNTIERKVREAFIALKMEEVYSKDEILMMYLNTIYYGHGAYGIQAASRTYLSKDAKDLTLAEAALMIGLPNSPSYYDPTVNPDLSLDRRNKVLGNMLRLGSITQEEHDAAVATPIELNVTATSDTGVDVKAHPYFVEYVKTLLQEEFSTDVLFKGGLTVKTTIDPAVQASAEKAAVENINLYEAANDLNIGMTVVEPKTGYIKAMVGGRDYYADENHTNHALSIRQPGSTFKIFTLATAIHMGMNPDITVNCSSPMTWELPGETFTGQNYGNINYGYMSLARATEVSSNTGYLQVAEALGNQNILETCRKLGIDTSGIDDVFVMTLGSGEVSTLQMAGAMGTLASGGEYRKPVAVTEILSREGEVLFKHQDAPERALTTGEAREVTRVLEGTMANGTATGANPWVNNPVAGKTGTAGDASDATDLWFCGYSPQYAVSIWVGNSLGNTSVGYLTTADMTQPVFRNFMADVLADAPREEFPEGTAPTYKDDKEWEFSKTKSYAERAAEQAAAQQAAEEAKRKEEEEKKKQEEAKRKEEEEKKKQEEANKPTTPPPNPTPTPDPQPETPTPDPQPETPTTPPAGNSGNSGGSGGTTAPAANAA